MKNDTESIVREFLELWQKQCAYMAKDGDALSSALDSFRKMQEDYVDSIGAGVGKNNAKSTTAAGIFRNISHEFGNLAKHYAELDKRIAELESCFAATISGTTKKTASTKPARARKRAAKTSANKAG